MRTTSRRGIVSCIAGPLVSAIGSLGVLGMVACQTYTPLVVSPANTGADVRVTLTDQGTASLGNALGNSAHEVEGTVTAVTDSTIVLAVSQVTRVSGVDETWKGERVTVPRNEVATIERKQTSVARSVIVAGALVGGAYLAARGGTGNQVGSPKGGSSSSGQ